MMDVSHMIEEAQKLGWEGGADKLSAVAPRGKSAQKNSSATEALEKETGGLRTTRSSTIAIDDDGPEIAV